ncbi:hypothetical protein ASG43_05345 [Aureimonas sp. Leaf454]|nr:hypothetical protein ASG43_05345 [Aureimonas sp. Leaf454]
MLPNADTTAVRTTDEIFCQTDDDALERPSALRKHEADVAELLRHLATGCFSGDEDTYRLGMSNAA